MTTPRTTRRQLFGLLAGAAAVPAQPKRPNILFIYTDDHSYRTVSAYPEAYPWVRTPNIDALAKEGIRFTTAYIGTWCMPSRAALLTGHYQFGVESMKMEGLRPRLGLPTRLEPLQVHRHRHPLLLRPAHHLPRRQDRNPQALLHRPVHRLGHRSHPRQRPQHIQTLRHLNEYAGVDTPKDIFSPRPGKPDWAQKSTCSSETGTEAPSSGAARSSPGSASITRASTPSTNPSAS